MYTFKLYVLALLAMLVFLPLKAQYYASGSFSLQFVKMPVLNNIVQQFNARENHNIKDFSTFQGYHFTIGNINEFSLIELGFASSMSNNKSKVPNQLREFAQVNTKFSAATVHLAYRIFRNKYLFAGIGINYGKNTVKYSFGGNYFIPVKSYSFAPEIFVDYSIKLRFLLKKDQRKDRFYMLRIRPFYQFHTQLELGAMQRDFNNATNVNATDPAYREKWSNFGIRIGLVIPFAAEKKYNNEASSQSGEKLSPKEIRERIKMKQ